MLGWRGASIHNSGGDQHVVQLKPMVRALGQAELKYNTTKVAVAQYPTIDMYVSSRRRVYSMSYYAFTSPNASAKVRSLLVMARQPYFTLKGPRLCCILRR